MSYDTYEEFSDRICDTLSSGSVFECSSFHREQITELLSEMDRDRVIEDLNIFYATQEPYELREGELELIAELVKGKVSTRIVFE